MKKTQQQQQYKYEEFDEHISLYNCIPAGEGNSLVLLRKLVNGIQCSAFNRNPSIIITGENSRELAIATANTLCSSDIREIEAKYLCTSKSQMDYFSDSLFDAVHIITNINAIGMSSHVVWTFMKNREFKFGMMDGSSQYVHCQGIIILTAPDIKSIPLPLVKAADFKVNIEQYTQEQLELLVHQRLKFCGIDYGDNEDILKMIVEYCQEEILKIFDLLRICILLAQTDHQNILTLKTVKKASKL